MQQSLLLLLLFFQPLVAKRWKQNIAAFTHLLAHSLTHSLTHSHRTRLLRERKRNREEGRKEGRKEKLNDAMEVESEEVRGNRKIKSRGKKCMKRDIENG
ncbi:hypothetical protein E2C01_097282 [Portunus trituberculatus]|uniref:Secreted protein n=1 Tax=Portunus trituberculatus TaxID=210409 RepID=A0A5B7JUS6_PORTR|nr:hypothetical protein [Portunus trituberculatus]